MNILYEAHASATGGRSGHVTTDDGALDLQLSLPKSLGGSGGAGTNPEQLFAGGYAACFENALIPRRPAAEDHPGGNPRRRHGGHRAQ